MTLLIVSHTDHYDRDGQIVGWSSTVQEINELARSFTKVIHVACLHKGDKAPPGYEPYSRDNIEFIPIPPAGGKGIRTLTNLLVMPIIVRTVFSQLKRVTCFQFRAPTGIGLYMIPLLTWFSRKPGWYKYAGDWSAKKIPLTYAAQRTMLKWWKARKVTINGTWRDTPPHCITFENPCLTESAIESGQKALYDKRFVPPYNIVFVGRLDRNKGVELLVRALVTLEDRTLVGEVHLVGDGPERGILSEIAQLNSLRIIFHGFLPRESVFEVLKKGHVLILPSASEGFPKVVAEAWNFGCVPLVTRVSAIDQYVKEGESGFLIEPRDRSVDGIRKKLTAVLQRNDLKVVAGRGRDLVCKFSYEYYRERVVNEILR